MKRDLLRLSSCAARAALVSIAIATAPLVAGCQADLGACDIEAARSPIYYDDDGFPAYPGQAIVEVSCGQGRYCHSSGILPEERFGVPVGLEFDVGVTTDPGELERLRHARRAAFNMRHEMLGLVDNGTMPPGPPSGDIALAGAPRYRAYIGTPDERELPWVGDDDGREILRNWLACGAHVIEATSGESTGIGDIVPREDVCPAGQAACGAAGECVDTRADPANCGGCGVACGAAQTCELGACTCSAGLTACGASCVDPTSDVSNCGGCGISCGTMVCAASACTATCPAGTTDCGGSCVSLDTSPANCGGCGRACGAGEVCAAGSCACSAGLTNCGGACVDTTSDAANCGTCGSACAAGATCSGGACGCPAGTTDCGGSCTNTSSDPGNCGSCGMSCGASAGCSGGTCTSCGPDVSFAADVLPIFARSCLDLGCHSGARAAASLALDATRAYAELVNVPASCGGSVLVRPGSVATSYLVNKLTNVDICSGTEMPKRGMTLPPAEIELVRSWICHGAANN